jgi:hypothetical protein
VYTRIIPLPRAIFNSRRNPARPTAAAHCPALARSPACSVPASSGNATARQPTMPRLQPGLGFPTATPAADPATTERRHPHSRRKKPPPRRRRPAPPPTVRTSPPYPPPPHCRPRRGMHEIRPAGGIILVRRAGARSIDPIQSTRARTWDASLRGQYTSLCSSPPPPAQLPPSKE